MPIYSITAPDGKTYEVEGPEGATTDQVKAEVLRQHPHLAAVGKPEPSLERAISRIGPDIREYVAGVKEMVTSPVQSARAIAGLIEPVAMRLTPAGMVSDTARMAKTGTPFTPEQQAMGRAMAGVASDPLGTITEHPFQTAITVLPVVGQAAKAANLPRIASAATTAGTVLDPVAMTGKGLLAGGKYIAAPIVDATGRVINNMRASPTRAVGNELLAMTGNDPNAVIAALRATQGMETTPGYTPTLAERAYAGGASNPTLAATENRLLGANPELNRQLYEATQRNVAALQEQLARVQERIRLQANALSPQAKADLANVQQSLQASLADEQARLGQFEQSIRGGLSAATPQTTGTVLAERGKALRQEVKQTVTAPAYRRAYAAAGDAAIDVSRPIAVAEEILGRKLSEFAPETAPSTVAALARMQARAQEAVAATGPKIGALGEAIGEGKAATAAIPPNASLQEIDDIRKAINADIAAARTSTSPTSATQLRNLQRLHSALDDAVFRSDKLSDAAKEAYQNALTTYRTEYAPRFKTGVAADLFRGTNKNQPRLLADNAVDKFLSNETAADQFVTTFRNDPAANAAMREGVERLYRDAVSTPDQHAAFMKKYGDQIDRLDRAGLGLRQQLETVGKDVERLATGRDALAARAKTLGVESMDKLIDKALASPSTMREVLGASDAPARAAMAQELLRRATQNLDGATQYLKENADAIKRALQADDPATAARRYNEAVDVAKWHDEFKAVQAPTGADANIRINAQLEGKFTDSQLHDLTLVARDVKRSQEVNELAGFGRQADMPDPRRIATRGASETLGNAPLGYLDAKITTARNLYKIATGGMDKKVAMELARVMYTDPDAAIAMLQAAAKRQAAKQTRRAVYAAPANALSKAGKPSIAVNALTSEESQ